MSAEVSTEVSKMSGATEGAQIATAELLSATPPTKVMAVALVVATAITVTATTRRHAHCQSHR